MFRFPRLLAAVLIAAASLAPSTASQEGRAAAAYNLGTDQLALQGYDPVAYFDVGGAQPRKGDALLRHAHEGAAYHFATEENRALFQASPETYEPAYGGWCAYAMSKNVKVQIDPAAFRVSAGRLFLFVDVEYLEFDGDWVPDEARLIARADANWKAMSGEGPRMAEPGTYRLVNEWNLGGPSVALAGFDPVSYFPEGGSKPLEGKKKLMARHKGVLYRFASEKNREAFKAAPTKYEPAHGGWCSYAMGASGEKVEVDPEAFRIHDGQLHLFYVGWFSDTREDWDEDTANLKTAADSNWETLLKKALEKARPNS